MSTPSSSPVIAISGASAGIGLAIAEHFARLSWGVSITARTRSDLDLLAERWAKEFPDSRFHAEALDLAKPESAKHWANSLQETFGRVDVLVHNLGQFQAGTLLEGPEDQLGDFLTTNVLSAHHLSRAILPILKVAKDPCMITIGSVATTDWPPPLAAYSISKYALEGWHREVSKELAAQGIRTGLVRPGATYTRSWDGIDVDPTTLLSPDQVAQCVAQLVFSDKEGEEREITIRPPELS